LIGHRRPPVEAALITGHAVLEVESLRYKRRTKAQQLRLSYFAEQILG
jgi:hypothetical protein